MPTYTVTFEYPEYWHEIIDADNEQEAIERAWDFMPYDRGTLHEVEVHD